MTLGMSKKYKNIDSTNKKTFIEFMSLFTIFLLKKIIDTQK